MNQHTFYMPNHNAFSVTSISENVVRIRYNGDGVFRKSLMERYDIIAPEPSDIRGTFSVVGNQRIFKAGNIEVVFHEDASFSVHHNGNVILNDIMPFHPQEDIGCGGKIVISDSERFYGCGYRPMNNLELRGHIIKNWSAPVTNNGPSTFFMSSMGWGLFWNNTCETFFDFANRESDKVVFWSNDGEFDIYIFAGNFKDMIMDFTSLTGKPSLMPLNGYGITVVNGEAENEISLLDKAERLRREKIPCDNFSISCEWMTEFYDKSINQEFDSKRYFIHKWMDKDNVFFKPLKRLGIKCTLWTPCEYDLTHEQERRYFKKHPEDIRQPLYEKVVYRTGNSEESIDANSKRFRDPNLFPVVRHDPYTIPEEPWYEHFKRFYDLGIIGLAEDGSNVQITKIDHFYANGYSYKYMHNLNQTLNSLQYFESYKEYTGKRFFVRTPSTFIGHQKYCGTWCGDTTSDISLLGLMQYSFQGQSNVTADMISTDPAQIHSGMLMPWVLNFCWAYPVWPWMLEDELREIYVYYARLRYALMPYIYTAAYNTHVTGISMCTAMVINYPEDERFFDNYHQYMFGESLLVGALSNTFHLPEGKWIDYWTGKEYSGKTTLTDAYPKNRGGYLFIKKGAIIPYWEDIQYVDQKPIDSMTIRIYPDQSGEYILYEDDGISFDFEKEGFAKTAIGYLCENDKITVHIDAHKGSYSIPENRKYHMELYMDKPASLPADAYYDAEKNAVCFTLHENESYVVNY